MAKRRAAEASAPTDGEAGEALAAENERLRMENQRLRVAAEAVGVDPDHMPPSIVVFSGGTAFNSVAEHLSAYTRRVSHVLPVSDDGGSTAEIVRVLGGPAVGDIRSRCLRLSDESDEEARAVKRLLKHRLTKASSEEAKLEWNAVVEGSHPLWDHVSAPYKHTIRSFLVHFQSQILRHATEHFDFAGGSIGNFFFAGARTFFRSMDAAIFLYSRVSGIPPESRVLPSVRTEGTVVLGAELRDGTIMRGQNAISHPAAPDGGVDKRGAGLAPLANPIHRVFYVGSETASFAPSANHFEVFPPVNEDVVRSVQGADIVLYGMGSLYTSICPSLVLIGMGETIASRRGVPKVLILNGSHDRETHEMTAADFVRAVTDALNRASCSHTDKILRHSPSEYVTHIVVPEGGAVPIDRDALASLGVVSIVEVASMQEDGKLVYEPGALVDAFRSVAAESKASPLPSPSASPASARVS